MRSLLTGKVIITESGRDGSVRYSRGARSIDGYWSFGGGDVVAIVSMGAREEWQSSHPWALADRTAILRFIAGEVLRQRAPTCAAEIDEPSGDILVRQGGAAGSGPSTTRSDPGAQAAEVRAATFVHRHARIRSMLGLGVLAAALLAAAGLWLGKQMFPGSSAKGTPLNACVRTDRHVAALIQSTDSHRLEISGRGRETTTTVRILLIPLDGSPPRVIAVASGLPGASCTFARILGSDGHTLWFDAAGLYGVRLDDHELVTADDLSSANPTVNPHWWEDPRGMDLIDGKLHVVNDDRSAALDVDPVSWQAVSVKPRVSRTRFNEPEPPNFLAAGLLSGNGVWLGVHAQAELDGDFAPGQRVRAVERAVDARRPRRLFLGDTEVSGDGDHRRILRMTQVGDTEFWNAAFLRHADEAAPLRLTDPDSVLMMFTKGGGTQGTVVIARVDLQGRVLWTVDTGLDRFSLQQVLPGAETFAFVGTRPPVPDQPGEPLVVLVDNATGKVTSHSLWR